MKDRTVTCQICSDPAEWWVPTNELDVDGPVLPYCQGCTRVYGLITPYRPPVYTGDPPDTFNYDILCVWFGQGFAGRAFEYERQFQELDRAARFDLLQERAWCSLDG